jgi:dihydrofolate reductase/thymidylate synthase
MEIVVAATRAGGIGMNGGMPWPTLRADLKRFSEITRTSAGAVNAVNAVNAIVMGRRTFDSIPATHRPLPGRLSVVLTQSFAADFPPEVKTAVSLHEALELLGNEKIGKIFIIGGAECFREAMAHPRTQRIYLTLIDNKFECDTFVPPYTELLKTWTVERESTRMSEAGVTYRFIDLVPRKL